MKLNQKTGATIAMTAAALFVSGTIATSAMAGGAQGKCFGVNACKGQSGCKTAQSDCKGHNACKGKGWVSMTAAECAEQGGEFKS